MTSAEQLFGAVPVHVTAPIEPRDPWLGPVPMAKVRLLPSASVPVSVIVFAVSSFVDTDCAFATGAVFAAVTVNVWVLT